MCAVASRPQAQRRRRLTRWLHGGRKAAVEAASVTAGAVRCIAWLGDVGLIRVIPAVQSCLELSLQLHQAIREHETPKQQTVFGWLALCLHAAPDVRVGVAERI